MKVFPDFKRVHPTHHDIALINFHEAQFNDENILDLCETTTYKNLRILGMQSGDPKHPSKSTDSDVIQETEVEKIKKQKNWSIKCGPKFHLDSMLCFNGHIAHMGDSGIFTVANPFVEKKTVHIFLLFCH